MYSSAMILKVWSTDQQKSIPGSLLEMPNLKPHPDPQNQGLHFNKIPWKAVSTWKLEKYYSRAKRNWEKNDVRNDYAKTNNVLHMCHEVCTDEKDWRVFLSKGLTWCVTYKDSSSGHVEIHVCEESMGHGKFSDGLQ